MLNWTDLFADLFIANSPVAALKGCRLVFYKGHYVKMKPTKIQHHIFAPARCNRVDKKCSVTVDAFITKVPKPGADAYLQFR